MSDANGTIRLEDETFDKAVAVADGVWLLATRHRPGFSKMQPEVNNRCFIFRVTEGGKPILFVSNGVDPKAIPEVKRIEQETGLAVRYVMSPGGGHHLMMPAWADAFPAATVLLPPVRIPSTTSGAELVKRPNVKTMSIDDPLPQLRGQLDCVIFDGLLGFPDMKTTYEGGKEGFFTMFKIMKEMMSLKTPVDEVWLRHAATGLVIGGENLGWILSKESVSRFPFMMRKMFKADTVYVQSKGRKVGDPARVERAWRAVLAWPCRTLVGYHEPPGEGFVGDGQAALTEAARAVKQIPAA